MSLQVKEFFDSTSATFSYVITDSKTKKTAVIDPVMHFDQFSGKLSYHAVESIIQYIEENNLDLEWILETHIHADHLTAATVLKNKFHAKIGIGTHIKEVLEYWVPFFNMEQEVPMDGSQFDQTFEDNETLSLGDLLITVIHTPGHTPACVSYIIEDSIFVGDTVFMPDVGTARADFPGGDAEILYHSIKRILSLPESTKLFVCHDYPPNNRQIAFQTTVGEQNAKNIMINKHIDRAEFVSKRQARDQNLPVPKLLFPSLQVNLRSGDIVNYHGTHMKFLKLPVVIT